MLEIITRSTATLDSGKDPEKVGEVWMQMNDLCAEYKQCSPQADIKAERVGVVWAEFVNGFSSHIKVELTMKAEWAALPKGPGENTV